MKLQRYTARHATSWAVIVVAMANAIIVPMRLSINKYDMCMILRRLYMVRGKYCAMKRPPNSKIRVFMYT